METLTIRNHACRIAIAGGELKTRRRKASERAQRERRARTRRRSVKMMRDGR